MQNILISVFLIFGPFWFAFADQDEPEIIPPLDHTEFAAAECKNIFETVPVEKIIAKHRVQYEEMKERILNGTSGQVRIERERAFWRIVLKVIESTEFFNDRLETGRFLFDPALASEHMLNGIFIYAQSLRDLLDANEIFYLSDPHGRNFDSAAAKNKGFDFDLHYFAARMAFLSMAYSSQDSSSKSRDEALSQLTKFEGMNAEKLHINSDGNRTFLEMQDTSILRKYLSRLGLTGIAEFPMGAEGLIFNNGRRFFEYTPSPSEQWVSRYLAQELPRESILGLGDGSVRQFFRLFHFNNSTQEILFNPNACDFLSVFPTRQGWVLQFALRELKFTYKDVKSEKAVQQLQSSSFWLHEAYPNIVTSTAEILLPRVLDPRRGHSVISFKDKMHQLGGLVYANDSRRRYLLDFNGNRVYVTSGTQRTPIVVHQFDIPRVQFDRIRQ